METRAKMSAARTGQKRTDEQRAHMSAARTGLKLSDEAKVARREKMAARRAALELPARQADAANQLDGAQGN